MYDGPKRRRTDMPNFETKGEFEGYTVATLEAIKQRLDVLPCGETSKRVSAVEQKVANIEGRATIFGLVMGFLGGLVGKIFLGK